MEALGSRFDAPAMSTRRDGDGSSRDSSRDDPEDVFAVSIARRDDPVPT
jgi:hypothetical protein